MNNSVFNYQLPNNTVIFTDTLKKNTPYISENPRDHESLFVVTNGTLLYEKGSYKECIKEGQIGYIARGSVDKSSAYLCEDVSYIAVNFCFDKENVVATLPFKTLCSHGNAYNYESLFTQALSFFLSKTPGYMEICNGLVAQIIGHLYNEYRIPNADIQKSQKIEQSVDFLKKHFADSDFKIGQLAQIANMSEKHFRRIFFDVYKKTPYVFLQEFRINKAEILLLYTSKSISEIAIQCGFSDVYSFSHSFKKHNGMSPSEYRTKF